MNDIQIFNNSEFGEIRTITKDGEPMFCLTDICKALGLTQPSKVKERLNEKGVNSIPTLTAGGEQKLLYINESNLYKTIFQSRKESAERFTEWVTSEVLPSIRKTGSYNAPPMTIPEQIQLLAKGNVEIHKRMDDMQSEITSIKLDLPILPIEADKITSAVRKKGIEILGGKESTAYNDRGLRQLLYNSIYANVKYNFNIKSYKSIKRCECDKAIEIINEYQPPFFLQQRINTENLQQKFDMPC